MSKHPEDDLVFAGDSADNAEDFITAVNRASWRAGKQEDSKWTAQLAYSCFAKGALIWYEGLSDKIKQDWKLLRTAIILEYVAPSGPTDTPGESAAGSTLKDRDRRATVTGRIRVKYTTAGRDWYLASKLYDDTWSTVSSTVDGAALFQFNTTKKTIKYLVSMGKKSPRSQLLTWGDGC
ncbi:hypothetical protein FRC04_004043 [Tulasnella sp. 424]|nr:hypothetical protein FRC04_004043 [Tulasnella sp. 424]